MRRGHDAVVEVTMQRDIVNGYRPQHRVLPDYQTSGEIELIDRASLRAGESALARIWYLSPEAYPKSLWVGKVIDVCEGSRVVGSTRVVEVCNPVLLGVSEAKG